MPHNGLLYDEEKEKQEAVILQFLNSLELPWRDKQPFLESKGYMLRPRYRQNWMPTKDENDLPPYQRVYGPYSVRLQYPYLMDATRISDGRLVCLRSCTTSYLLADYVAAHMSSGRLFADADNHCVPVMDMFIDEENPKMSYVVMPFLRHMDDPPFELVNDIVDLVDQLLEGLAHMHQQRIAHRDCTHKSIMMDARSLYPRGFHPIKNRYLPDMTGHAKHWPRILTPVRYYYVGLGDALEVSAHVRPEYIFRGPCGRDYNVPEFSWSRPYDPFKVDIFVLGNMFRRHICPLYSNVQFLKPLVKSMTAVDPSNRPDATAALQQWRMIRRKISFLHRVLPLHGISDSFRQTLALDVITSAKLGVLLIQRLLQSVHRLAVSWRLADISRQFDALYVPWVQLGRTMTDDDYDTVPNIRTRL